MSRFQRVRSAMHPIHITGRCNNREPFPVSLEFAWETFENYLHLIRNEFGIRILAFVMMPNHFHLLCRDPDLNLGAAMQYFMRETSVEIARRAKRTNRIWGSPYRSSIITTDAYYLNAYRYIYRNPVAGKLCLKAEEYPWSSLAFLIGSRKSILPLEEDQTLFTHVDGTLKWLAEPFTAEEVRAFELGLRKKVFEFPKDGPWKRLHPMARKPMPEFLCGGSRNVRRCNLEMVELTGIEPAT